MLKKKLQKFSVEQLEQRKEFTFYCCGKPLVSKNPGSTGGTVTPPRGDTGGGIPF